MASDAGNLDIALVAGLVGGIYYFFNGFRIYRKYRLLADTPVMPIRSIAMGLVEVHGKAKGEQLVLSPVSHTSCLFYKVEIEKWVKDSKGRGRWADFKTDADGVKFYLEDATGKVLVDAHGAELDLLRNSRREVGERASRGFGALFSGISEPGSGADWVTDSELSDYVRRVAAGTPSLLPEPNWGSSGSPQTTQRQVCRHPAHYSTRQGLSFLKQILLGGNPSWGVGGTSSGRYRLTEYCILPEHWYDVTGTCTENPHPQDEHDRNLIVKGENEPTFLISWKSEKELEGGLRRRAALYVFGGAAVAVLCLAMLLGRFGWL